MTRIIYVETLPQFSHAAKTLARELKSAWGISKLTRVRILTRYTVLGMTEDAFLQCAPIVFAEPATTAFYYALPNDADAVIAAEYLPGQYDARASAAEKCAWLAVKGERQIVKVARVYLLYGDISQADIAVIKKKLINPVDSREALTDIESTQSATIVRGVRKIEGFTSMSSGSSERVTKEMGLAMDKKTVARCQNYFRLEGRDPTETEMFVLDAYSSDHCRHTTFTTELTQVSSDDEDVLAAYQNYLRLREQLGDKKSVCLMDMGTIGAKALRNKGLLDALDISREINACTVRITADIDGAPTPYLLLFKNETHNHPTEIEPFGGAATCIGGAIRDPLSGRGYVYQAMRVTGAADPRTPVSQTLSGKLPQRQLTVQAAQGYSSYGNQIGVPTGLVHEFYHEGYAAKRMEIGAVIGAVPAELVRRETPKAGDVVILVGGRTGRDGVGGASGSSKAHDKTSVSNCGAEVQKGNAPEERKLQRLFRNPRVLKMIKRCNDFGAGGVSVAIGELADGLIINLDAVPKKYDGLNVTELAISESQERMAVVVDKYDAEDFIREASKEDVEATVTAVVTDGDRLIMTYGGQTAVDISREFLDNAAASHSASAKVEASKPYIAIQAKSTLRETLKNTMSDLNVCSQKGLIGRFDSTVGANTVLFPMGGRHTKTPMQSMAALLPVQSGSTTTCSLMSFGFDPFIASASPFRGAYISVAEAVSKLAAAGASTDSMWLSLQEYFEKLRDDPARWGKPVAAVLGALQAQTELSVAAIGGKDSMSGSFETLDVPPTLVAFAAAVADVNNVISGEFKRTDSEVWLFAPHYRKNGLPDAESLKKLYSFIGTGITNKNILSAYVPTRGGLIAAVAQMCMGNAIGVSLDAISLDALAAEYRCGFVAEWHGGVPFGADGNILCEDFTAMRVGVTSAAPAIALDEETVGLDDIESFYSKPLEEIFPTDTPNTEALQTPEIRCEKSFDGNIEIHPLTHSPSVVIPIFAGTNCEYETMRAFDRAGIIPKSVIIRTMTAEAIRDTAQQLSSLLKTSQILFIPGGFSNGDEPDGSGKFIAAFMRNPLIAAGIDALLDGGGLIGGICNGFQALIRLGLVPYGRIVEPKDDMPVLAANAIGVHQSQIVRLRVASRLGPWMSLVDENTLYSVPVSHGEGRFMASEALLNSLAQNGQILTQYANADGKPSMSIDVNPNGSMWAVEGICSPDGRIFGKMGHSERIGKNLYKNVEGEFDMRLFDAAARYFGILNN